MARAARTQVPAALTCGLRTPMANPWDVAIFNPHGNVIVFFYNNSDAMSFVPVISPACGRTGGCLQFQPKSLFGQGTALAWAR